MTHRGPFQPLPFCDSVISSLNLTALTLDMFFCQMKKQITELILLQLSSNFVEVVSFKNHQTEKKGLQNSYENLLQGLSFDT